MPKLDLDAIAQTNRTGYPAPYDQAVAGRWYRRLAPAAGVLGSEPKTRNSTWPLNSP